ncbi:MAG TPA: hypothetical protein VMW17_01995 [Candidatus Binatia bacterium]|nr:hypothetical protein [Candidatus Binatia bacterium]
MSADSVSTSRGAGFRYGDLQVWLDAPPSHLAWLEEFLTPNFTVRSGGTAACRVSLREDDAAFDATHARGPQHPAVDLECFALDSKVIRLPAWNASEGGTTVFDPKFDVFLSMNTDHRTITVLTRCGNLGARQATMRVVRELAMNHTQAAGGLFLHASALAINGCGMIIAGKRAAGKTTLLMHLLRHPSARYVTNDRALVCFDGVPPTLRGMPTVVTLRPRTLEMLPGASEVLLASGYHARLTLTEAAQRPPGSIEPWRDKRYGITPAQFRAVLGVQAIAESPLAVLVFPRITGEPGMVHIAALDPAVAAERLRVALFGAGSWRKHSDVLTVPGDPPLPDEAALAGLCARLTAQVRCVECALGLNAYERHELAGEMLDQLLAA